MYFARSVQALQRKMVHQASIDWPGSVRNPERAIYLVLLGSGWYAETCISISQEMEDGNSRAASKASGKPGLGFGLFAVELIHCGPSCGYFELYLAIPDANNVPFRLCRLISRSIRRS